MPWHYAGSRRPAPGLLAGGAAGGHAAAGGSVAPGLQGVVPPDPAQHRQRREIRSGRGDAAATSFFLTSNGPGKGGDLGGIAGADRHCQSLAQAAGAGSKTWRAYLSTQAADGQPAVNAKDRIGKDLARNEELLKTGAASCQTVDQQRADLASAVARGNAANAKLEQMRSPTGRQYEIAAQSAMVAQAGAALAQAEWQFNQRRVSAPVGALVADTYARTGETIMAGVPIVSLLPPQNILVRFFVPETVLGSVHLGDRLMIGCDGCAPAPASRRSLLAISG